MKTFFNRLALILVVLLVATSAHAQAPEWNLDPAHSRIYFSIQHIFSQARGYFENFKGEVRFSPEDLATSSFNFEIETKSINTSISKRDNHLRSADFFDADRYPLIKFKSSSVKQVEGRNYIIEGTMTVKDVSKKVSVPLTLLGVKPFPFDKNKLVAGMEARMKIDRMEYGVGNGKFLKMGVVGKEVDVLVTLELIRDK
jgi:polyisoprenoid-binding protein YceI